MANLGEKKNKPPHSAEKELKLSSKRAIDLLLSLLGNRGITHQRLSNPGKAYEDATLGIIIHASHSKKFENLKMSWAKLHYRRMISLDSLLEMSSVKIKNCRNELLKIDMLGNMLIYLVELMESCGIVMEDQNSASSQKAKKLKNKYGWMKANYEKLKVKQKKNEDFTMKVKKSMKEIPVEEELTKKEINLEKEESINQIAQKAMESLLKSEILATSATEFERQMDSFKENPLLLSKYLFKYSSEQIDKIYSKRAIEANYVLKIISCLNQLTEDAELKEAGRVMEVILNLKKSVLTFKMMIKRERRELRDLLEKINKIEPITRLGEYRKNFRLPEN